MCVCVCLCALLFFNRVQADKLKEESSAMATSSDTGDEEGNPSNSSVRKVLSTSSNVHQSRAGSQHSFQHRLDNYQSVMDDDYGDQVAEAKSSSRSTQQRKSFEDTTHTVAQTLGQYAKSSSNLADMSKETSAPSSSSLESPAKSVPSSSQADAKSSPSSNSSSSSAAGFGSKDEQQQSPGASSRFHVARPHHLPKMNALSGLSGNLEKIRMTMGEEVNGMLCVLLSAGAGPCLPVCLSCAFICDLCQS